MLYNVIRFFFFFLVKCKDYTVIRSFDASNNVTIWIRHHYLTSLYKWNILIFHPKKGFKCSNPKLSCSKSQYLKCSVLKSNSSKSNTITAKRQENKKRNLLYSFFFWTKNLLYSLGTSTISSWRCCHWVPTINRTPHGNTSP